MNNYTWIGSPDTSLSDCDGCPGSAWIIHLFNRAEAKMFKPYEDSEDIGYIYKSCCGKDTITTVDPPSEPDTDFMAEPPVTGVRNEELYCKDCIKIWNDMQSRSKCDSPGGSLS